MEHRGLQRWLIAGDVLAIWIISMIGFLTHYGAIQGWRWLTTFIPVLVAWFAIAPWLGVYRWDLATNPRQAWRAGLAAFLSAPMAAWLRAVLLGAPVLPLFVLILGLTDALGFLIWRFLWPVLLKRWSATSLRTTDG